MPRTENVKVTKDGYQIVEVVDENGGAHYEIRTVPGGEFVSDHDTYQEALEELEELSNPQSPPSPGM